MGKNKGSVYVYQQITRTRAEWLADNPVIPDRVMVFESDTLMMRMGDGKTHYADLDYRLSAGLPPRVSETTGCWEIWDVLEKEWVDTGIKPMLATNIDGGRPNSVYTPDQVIDFGKP